MAKKHEDETSQPKGDEDISNSNGRLLDLVEKDLRSLAKYWIGVLRDYAFLMLPKQYFSQLPKEGGIFYRYVYKLKSSIEMQHCIQYYHVTMPLICDVSLRLKVMIRWRVAIGTRNVQPSIQNNCFLKILRYL